jgi:methyl coenzyme M reductase alpha subunit
MRQSSSKKNDDVDAWIKAVEARRHTIKSAKEVKQEAYYKDLHRKQREREQRQKLASEKAEKRKAQIYAIDVGVEMGIIQINKITNKDQILETARALITKNKPGLIWTLRLSSPNADIAKIAIKDYLREIGKEAKKGI